MFTIPSGGRGEMWRAVTGGRHAEGVVTRGMQMCLLRRKQREVDRTSEMVWETETLNVI
jgi:hypothetical protein